MLDFMVPSLLVGVIIASAIVYGATGKLLAFGRADYDPNEVAKDGPFRAPRKWLHVQKVMTACTVYAIALAIFLGIDFHFQSFRVAAWVGQFGPLLFSKVRELVAPTDPDRHTFGEMATDAFTDASLYGSVWVLHAITIGDWRGAVLGLAGCGVIYRLCRNGARP